MAKYSLLSKMFVVLLLLHLYRNEYRRAELTELQG